jgi:hypothetical protein
MNEETMRLEALRLAVEYAANYTDSNGEEFSEQRLIEIATTFYNFIAKGTPNG